MINDAKQTKNMLGRIHSVNFGFESLKQFQHHSQTSTRENNNKKHATTMCFHALLCPPFYFTSTLYFLCLFV